ncbi:MAG: 6-phospho-3-hexuloisomerase [Leptolyngbya sp. BL-A-14]
MVRALQANTGDSMSVTATPADLNRAIELVLTEDRQVLKKISQATVLQLAQTILQVKRIFVLGEGRSGLVIRMVAMRLMHLGLQVYVVGETTTPSIQQEDLLIACSGSGSTGIVSAISSKAKDVGAIVVAVTTKMESTLAQIANLVIKIDAPTKEGQNHQQSQQFAGSLFEQATLLLFDALFYVLSQRLNKSADALLALHTNLE